MLAAERTATLTTELSAQLNPTGKCPEAGSRISAAVVEDRAVESAVCQEGKRIFNGMETVKARRHASLTNVSPEKTGHILQKSVTKLATTTVSKRLNPPKTARTCLTAPTLVENKDEVLTIKTLAALSSCVITSGAPTAAIVVPLQWRVRRNALWARRVQPAVLRREPAR